MKLSLFQKEAIKQDRVDIHYKIMTPLIESIVESINNHKSIYNLSVKSDRGDEHIIDVNDIYYFESVDNRIFAYLKESVYQIGTPLNECADLYSSLGFIRINKSNVVNVYKIDSIKPEANMRVIAHMVNGEKLMINRTYKKEFRHFLIERRNLK